MTYADIARHYGISQKKSREIVLQAKRFLEQQKEVHSMSEWAKSHDEVGYFAEGEPTDAQIELQDEIDNTIFNFMNEINYIYTNATGNPVKELDWDIEKITEIRHLVEKLLNLPDIY
jgi:hypothetical protein